MNSRTDLTKMGSHIAELRKKKKYTQKTLGELLDVSDKTVSKWEQGVVAPDITILKSLSSVLCVSIDELLAGEEIKEKDDYNTINAIDMYSKIIKAKLIKIFLSVISIILIISGIALITVKHYSWKVYDLTYEKNFYIKGYLFSNPSKSKIIINKIGYIKDDDDEIADNSYFVKSVSIRFYNKDELIYDKSIDYYGEKDIYQIFADDIISIEKDIHISKDNLRIIIMVCNDKNVEKEYFVNYD